MVSAPCIDLHLAMSYITAFEKFSLLFSSHPIRQFLKIKIVRKLVKQGALAIQDRKYVGRLYKTHNRQILELIAIFEFICYR